MKSTSPEKGKQRQEGWTLIEVLVAVVILCVGLLAVGTMQIAAIRGNFMGGNTSIALTLASEKMEDLLNRDYTDAALADSKPANNANLTVITTANVDHEEKVSDGGVVGTGGFYRRIWNVADTVTGASNWPTMKEITIIVTWENDRHRVTISSMRRP
jgi:prepilin-type N-terminal cleavage/methylation domain-containing protein